MSKVPLPNVNIGDGVDESLSKSIQTNETQASIPISIMADVLMLPGVSEAVVLRAKMGLQLPQPTRVLYSSRGFQLEEGYYSNNPIGPFLQAGAKHKAL